VLKKANRLKSKGDFKRTLSGRRLCINDCFVLYGLAAHPNSAGPFFAGPVSGTMQPRIGFVVSKKVHKRAVRRNLVRRRLREMVRTWLLSEKREILLKYRTLVFVARGRSVETPFERLRQKMEHCLRQL
jgi:ribonuclease P protein component